MYFGGFRLRTFHDDDGSRLLPFFHELTVTGNQSDAALMKMESIVRLGNIRLLAEEIADSLRRNCPVFFVTQSCHHLSNLMLPQFAGKEKRLENDFALSIKTG